VSNDETRAFRRAHLTVTPERIAKNDEAGEPDFSSEDYCHRCGGPNPTWSVDSDRFNAALGAGIDPVWRGIVCPGCFVWLHEEATGLTSAWDLVPVMFRHIDRDATQRGEVEA